MHRVFRPLCAFLLLLAGSAQAGTGTPPLETSACNFAKAYYIQDGGVVVVPLDHGFFYRHGVATPEGVRFKPGDTFVQYSSDRRTERDYWLMRVNWFNNRAYFHEQIYRYKLVRNSRGKLHRVRTRLLAAHDFTLTHFRGLVAFDHGFRSIEMHPGTQLWRNEQFPSYSFSGINNRF
jgi:hypothetical protein